MHSVCCWLAGIINCLFMYFCCVFFCVVVYDYCTYYSWQGSRPFLWDREWIVVLISIGEGYMGAHSQADKSS